MPPTPRLQQQRPRALCAWRNTACSRTIMITVLAPPPVVPPSPSMSHPADIIIVSIMIIVSRYYAVAPGVW